MRKTKVVARCAVALMLVGLLLAPATRASAAESVEGWCWMCRAWYGTITVDHDGDVVMLKECKLQLGPIPGVWCYYE